MTSTETKETLDAAPKLQIWNNAAFDNDDGGDSQVTSAIIEASWSSGFINESFDSDGSKENQVPLSVSSSLQSSVVSMTEPPRAKSKIVKAKYSADQIKRDIDAEIEEVEKEIGRLSNKLESLRLEKAEQTARSIAIRGRVVPAKFMESAKEKVKIEDSSFPGSKSRSTRRGVSMGPGEIFSAPKKSETMTPLQSAQNRRKSCFWKLPGIEESKVRKARGRTSLSLSPRSRKAATKITAAAATTVGSKRAVKREETVLSTIQPKKLFKEEEKNVAASRKPGRVVASRYSLISKTPQTAVEKDARKRSLPENQEKENQRSEKRRASDENNKSEGRVKKKWEIPNQVELYGSGVTTVNDETTTPIGGKELPKIRTLRFTGESPRDSGAAKRVSELQSMDRKFTFCQLLRFEE